MYFPAGLGEPVSTEGTAVKNFLCERTFGASPLILLTQFVLDKQLENGRMGVGEVERMLNRSRGALQIYLSK